MFFDIVFKLIFLGISHRKFEKEPSKETYLVSC